MKRQKIERRLLGLASPHLTSCFDFCTGH
uniref:Uncharacterized protein n=1 Tax=Rhizophora mucronata TaxID=61149 RepID=A0A2P2Q3A2_RHIMU